MLDVDVMDGWNPGRYYFDRDRAKLEVESWLRAREQWVEKGKPEKRVNPPK